MHARAAPPLRYFGPCEQSTLRFRYRQAGLGKTVSHHFEAMLVLHGERRHSALIGFQCHCTGLLDDAGRQYRGLPVHGLDRSQHFCIPSHKSTAPAGHHIHFGE